MKPNEAPDLAQLAESYDIIGELSGRDDARAFMGTRRSDNKPIAVTVFREPSGDEGNALSHLAADTNLLSGLSHRNLIPVLEGKWLGTDAFAVVTERVNATTLEEQLSRREEEFGYARIATILQEMNAVLDWARGQKVVHRGLDVDTIFLGAGSDRVCVRFTVNALPPNGIPGADSDARTIARLARAMLTRSVSAPERENMPLAELRPSLPSRVVKQTEALLSGEIDKDTFDLRGYIAAIAMSEELKIGETECQRVTQEMAEEQRITREALAAERKAHEEDLAEQARKFAKERADVERAMAKERTDTERTFVKEREELHRAVAKEREEMQATLAREREEMQRTLTSERAALESEIAKARKELDRRLASETEALERDRGMLVRERGALAKDREAYERASAKNREQIAAKLAALEAHAKLYENTAEIPVPDREVKLATLRESIATREESLPEPTVVELPSRRTGTPWWERVWSNRLWRNGSLAVVALLLLIGAAAIAVARVGERGEMTPLTAGSRSTMDSVGGAVGNALTAPDSQTIVLDTTPLPEQGPEPVPIEVPTPVTTRRDPPAPSRRVSTPPVDSVPVSTLRRDLESRTDAGGNVYPWAARLDSIVRRDSAIRSDSAARARLDTMPRLDSVRRDTLPRDTIPRRPTW
jgi:hypothetical protein